MFRIENAKFDSDLFGFSVGRLEVTEEQFSEPSNNTALEEALRQCYHEGTKLVYLFEPAIFIFPPPPVVNMTASTPPSPKSPTPRSRSGSSPFKEPGLMTFHGLKVDEKTTYTMELSSVDKATLIGNVYSNENIRIRTEVKKELNDSSILRDLAIASGEWSRFRVDTNINRKAFECIFESWMNNSVNRSIADEVFVAQRVETGEDVGFITVKKRGMECNIGLLAVSATCRRQGVARTLLSRAVLWALEQTAWDSNVSMTVVTQGANATACSCYENFGFRKYSIQNVFHVWLPTHLIEPQARSDHAPVPFCKQHLTGSEIDYVSQVLATGLDSASRFTLMCASRLKSLLGPDSERVIVVPSGTAALEMAALLIDFKPGDEVIMPSYTFSSTANAVVLRGAVPVFVDIRRDTLNIDENLIEAAITEKTKAICCVHYAGIPCEMDTICEIAQRHSLYVIEDAAQGFLSTYKGRQLGTIGDFGCFSFHYTKNVICGEGGAISVNRSPEFSSRALVLWEKGTNRYDFMTGKVDKYEWVDIGSSYVPSEVSCAILWAQLEKCEDITCRRVDNYERYATGLAPLVEKGLLRIPIIPEDCLANAHIFYVILRDAATRTTVGEEMKKRGVTAFSHYVPLHAAPAGKKYGRVGTGSESMTVTQEVFDGLLRLPMWRDLSSDDLKQVIDAMLSIQDML